MKTPTKSSLFDLTLTPHNAEKKGYKFIDDVIYDQRNPSEAMLDILDMSRMSHCKLGTPANALEPDTYFGLYMPLQADYEDF